MTQLTPKTKLTLSIHTLKDKYKAKDNLKKLNSLVSLSLDENTFMFDLSNTVEIKKKEVDV